MRKVVDNVRLMAKVCDMYYNQSVSQQQIANMLKLSRPTVSRLLSSAREQGIVQITISKLDAIEYWELERQLEEKYHLREVLIVDTSTAEDAQKDALGIAASQYLEHTIKSGNTVGVSMGSTLERMVFRALEAPGPLAENVTFVPMIGGMGQLRMELHSNSLAENLSRIYHGDFIPLHAPARVSNPKIRDEFLKEKSLSDVIRRMEHVDIAIVGIGYPNENSAIAATGYFKENELESLKERKVAGDICMQFFDENGDTSPYQNDNNVIGMDIHKLPKIPCSIGIAGGMEKLPAIKGAIKGHYINTLITDSCCANALLKP